jgi:hypothetical protein
MMNCFHWLICLSLAISQNSDSGQINYLASAWQDLKSTPLIKEALAEYNQGYNQACHKSPRQPISKQKCYQQGRKLLRIWLDNQVENCLALPSPDADSLAVTQCRLGSDTAFREIVKQREQNK